MTSTPTSIARGNSERHEVNVSKGAAVVIGLIAIYLGYIFEKQNVAFMVGLAFAVPRAATSLFS